MYSITLQTSDNIITSGDKLGQMQFAASSESDGSAAILVAGSVYCQAEGSFQSASNPASVVISTAAADASAAVGRIKITDKGHVLPMADNTYDLGDSNLQFRNGYMSEGIVLASNTPSVTTNKLYNNGGSLYFNGSAVGGGSYTAGSGLTLAGNEFNVYGGSGHFSNLEMGGTLDFGSSRFIETSTSSRLALNAGINGPVTVVQGGIYAAISGAIGFRNNWLENANIDCYIYRDAANTIAQRRSTFAQTFRVYNTYTSSTSYERGKLEWSSNVFNIGTELGSAGGGATPLSIQTSGTDRVRVDTDGDVGIGATSPEAQLHIENDLAADTGLIIRGATAQTANLQEWQNSASQVLSQIDSEGILTTDGIILPSDSPASTTNKLYNTGGTLYFDGSPVGGGTTYNAGSGITIDASDNIHVFGGTGNFRSISMTSHTPSPNTAQLYWDGTDVRFAGTKLAQISSPNASMVNKIPYFNSTSAITWDGSLSWDATNNRLGIGTDSPQREIHIAGSDTWGRLDRNNNSYGAAFLMTRGDLSAVVQKSWLFGLPNIAGLSAGADHFVIVDFGTDVGGTGGSVRLLVDESTGNVGIGETSADAQLHVTSSSSSKIGAIVQAATSQSANIQEWQNSSQQLLASISSNGTISTSGAFKTPINTESDGATITFDMNESNLHTVTLGGNRTLAVSNVGVGQKFTIRLTQDGTGTRTVTWFSTIKWPGNLVPTLTTTGGKTDVFGFICTSAGNYDGYVIGYNL